MRRATLGYLLHSPAFLAKMAPLALPPPPPPLARGLRWHFFLSHRQANSGDQCMALSRDLEAKGFRVWFDQQPGLDVTEV